MTREMRPAARYRTWWDLNADVRHAGETEDTFTMPLRTWVVGEMIASHPNFISSRLRDYLVNAGVPATYRKVTVLDSGGKVASTDHSFVAFTQIVDCLDIEASKVDLVNARGGVRTDRWATREDIVAGEPVFGCRRVVIHEDAIPAGAKVFVVAHSGGRVLVEIAFLHAMIAAGLDLKGMERESDILAID